MRKGSITALVVGALTEARRPMSLSELVDAVRAQGYRHATPPKNPDQLRMSIAALPSKSDRIRRVASGMYDLTDRQ
jgi:hypothetical protein